MDTVNRYEVGVCNTCRTHKDIVYTDAFERGHCVECFLQLPNSFLVEALTFLMESIPFKIGDKVECRTVGHLYDGDGVIDDISIEPEHWGTPVYPTFHVTMYRKEYDTAPDELWYPEACLKLIERPDE